MAYRPRWCNGCGERFRHPGKHQKAGKCKGKGWSETALKPKVRMTLRRKALREIGEGRKARQEARGLPSKAPSNGHSLEKPRFCPLCANGLALDARFCHGCGTRLSNYLKTGVPE